jgi:hypothetical protein
MNYVIKSLVPGQVSIINGGRLEYSIGEKEKVISAGEYQRLNSILTEYANCKLITICQVEEVDNGTHGGENTVNTVTIDPEINDSDRITELKAKINALRTQYKASTGEDKKNISGILKPLMEELKELEAKAKAKAE